MGMFSRDIEDRRVDTAEGLTFLTHPKAHEKAPRARKGLTTLHEVYPPEEWGGVREARRWRGRRARFLESQYWTVEIGSRYGMPYLLAYAPEDVTYVVPENCGKG